MRRSLLDGCVLAIRRVARARSLLLLPLPILFVALVGWTERSAGAAATDRTLTGATFGFAIPLGALALLRLVVPGVRLDESVLPLSRRGADRRGAALGLLATLSALAGVGGTILALVAVLATRSPADPRFTSDLVASAWIGGLGGAIYAWWLGFGASFGARGGDPSLHRRVLLHMLNIRRERRIQRQAIGGAAHDDGGEVGISYAKVAE